MPLSIGLAPQKSRLGVLLDHLSTIDDPRDVCRIYLETLLNAEAK